MSNTGKTILGFVRAWAARRLPFISQATELPDIYNYVLIEGLFPTSGQPGESELRAIAEAGYTRVINLAPTSMLENSVVEEADILADAGVDYVHLPVDFKAPTDADFQAFVDQVARARDEKLWVHCAANMRVSAFVYRYRTTVLKEDPAVARTDLERIWEPFGVWKEFVDPDRR